MIRLYASDMNQRVRRTTKSNTPALTQQSAYTETRRTERAPLTRRSKRVSLLRRLERVLHRLGEQGLGQSWRAPYLQVDSARPVNSVYEQLRG